VLPEGPYDTVAGYLMAELGRLPAVGDAVATTLAPTTGEDGTGQDFSFTVTELDGRRVARVRLSSPAPAAPREPIE